MSNRDCSRIREKSINQQGGRIVTDSVHERLRPPTVYCATCQETIPSCDTDIKMHFNPSHYSDHRCRYCQGKVFEYIWYKINEMGIETPQIVYIHNCRVRTWLINTYLAKTIFKVVKPWKKHDKVFFYNRFYTKAFYLLLN